MATQQEDDLRRAAKESLERIQKFDSSMLPREEELGKSFSFAEAVPSADRLIQLYKRLSLTALDDFASSQLQQLKGQADSDYNLFDQILKFDANQQNPKAVQQQLIEKMAAVYQSAFNILYSFIGYSLHKTADFERLDADARATLQGIKDDANKIQNELNAQKDVANGVLEQIRQVAAEQGVTQQAIYFKEAAEDHDTKSDAWKKRTVQLAWALGAYAVFSLIFHKIPFLKPVDAYEAFHLAASKVLIFAVISFMLYLAARNFLSHKHNAIVNRHRQNAL
ncbi:MAG: hypothetical protein JW902_15980, partial [Syntrophaceae bacterium]|nr:hypothetical protein [Syntrophaceae bacterium]